MPGSSSDKESRYRYLAWNAIGSIAVRKDDEELRILEIEFANSAINKNILIPDSINADIATLNLNGAFMARKGIAVDLDEYENDEVPEKYVS